MIQSAARKRTPNTNPNDLFAYEPPESLIIAERAAVTYALVRSDFFSLPEAAGLSPLSFWNDAYGQTYGIALEAHRRGDPVAQHVAARLADGEVPGMDYDHVKKLVREAGTGYDAGYYVEIVAKEARVRRMIVTAKEMAEAAKAGRVDAEHIASMVQPLVEAPKQRRMPTVVQANPRQPEQRPAVIYRLLRKGEVMNIVAPPKAGKSWLGMHLGFSVSTGTQFLEEFGTVQGSVLLIDNELHEEELAHRIEQVRRAYGYDLHEGRLSYVAIRGQGVDIEKLGAFFATVERDQYSLIVLDALYRMLPPGVEENSNDGMTRLYNMIDRYAAQTGAAFVLIHHTSKGSQGGKAVTDTGSGAGAQSRAADTHLVLRQHEEEGAIVVDAVTRSWAPPGPRVYRFSWPTWTPATDLDPAKLKSDRKPRAEKPAAQERKKGDGWDYQRFAREIVGFAPKTKDQIAAAAFDAGLSANKSTALMKAAKGAGVLIETPRKKSTDPWRYQYAPPESEGRWAEETDTPNPPHGGCGDLEGGTGGDSHPTSLNGGVKREALFDQHNETIR